MEEWWIGAVLTILFLAGFVFFLLRRKPKANNIDPRLTVGKSASVYLTIPGHRNGLGKVRVDIDGVMYDLDAMTESDAIASGSPVKILSVLENKVLMVEEMS